jgi:hypothetical protein
LILDEMRGNFVTTRLMMSLTASWEGQDDLLKFFSSQNALALRNVFCCIGPHYARNCRFARNSAIGSYHLGRMTIYRFPLPLHCIWWVVCFCGVRVSISHARQRDPASVSTQTAASSQQQASRLAANCKLHPLIPEQRIFEEILYSNM